MGKKLLKATPRTSQSIGTCASFSFGLSFSSLPEAAASREATPCARDGISDGGMIKNVGKPVFK